MVGGIPDESTHCSTGLNYQQLVDIPAPAGLSAGATWDCTILFNSDPVLFGTIMTVPSAGGTSLITPVINQVFGTRTYAATDNWLADFSHWRMMYGGLSIHLSAPATADQGVVVAAQYPYSPTELGAMSLITGGNSYTTRSPVVTFDQSAIIPGYSSLIAMPNAYAGNAKDGIYMPMKLESNHVRWHTVSDTRYDASGWAADPSSVGYVIPTSGPAAAWPYTEADGLWYNAKFYGHRHLMPCNSTFGGIVFRGLSQGATLNFTFRMGFEARCVPTSSFTSFLKVSPEHDLMAITNYYKVARQLKDAYPVAYNDMGRLWDLIKGAARVVSPVLSVVPGGELIKKAGGVLGKIGDVAFGSKKQADQAVSASMLEQAQKAVSTALSKQVAGAATKRLAVVRASKKTAKTSKR